MKPTLTVLAAAAPLASTRAAAVPASAAATRAIPARRSALRVQRCVIRALQVTSGCLNLTPDSGVRIYLRKSRPCQDREHRDLGILSCRRGESGGLLLDGLIGLVVGKRPGARDERRTDPLRDALLR